VFSGRIMYLAKFTLHILLLASARNSALRNLCCASTGSAVSGALAPFALVLDSPSGGVKRESSTVMKHLRGSAEPTAGAAHWLQKERHLVHKLHAL
jgi:hypothetical protein